MASAHEPGEVTWVSVHGGRLAVEVNSLDTEPVLAIHGISSQRKLWPSKWQQLNDVLVTVRPVPGVDHAASIMSMTGARATADLIAEALNTEALS